MTGRTLRRALGAAAICAALPVVAPAAASASTYTVDDDKAQCPNAAFSSIQEAVDQAAPWDTVVVCDGIYQEQSRPASGVESPSAPNSVNGLTITKPLTIKGAGAAKVTIMPRQSLTTLAGDSPYLRDGGGNVVTVSKQSREVSDRNTLFVEISGVTITSGTTYAEAGVAFFDASGTIRDSTVGPLVRAADGAELAARPHGWGVVATNHYQGAEAGPRREISIENSLVTGYQSGGVLFDVARGTDGAPENLQRSGIVSYGFVRGSEIRGSGASTLIPQTGVQYHAGQRGAVLSSIVRDNLYTPDMRRSVGLLLTDAETGADPANPAQRAFRVESSSFTGNGYGVFNADIANSAVRLGAPALFRPLVTATTESYFGCTGGPVFGGPSTIDSRTLRPTCQGVSGNDAAARPSLDLPYARPSAPAIPAVPGATADAAPTAAISEPAGGEVVVGEPFTPTVSARDDFGVRAVEVTIDGVAQPAASRAPYEFAGGWTPGYDEIGETHTIEASVVDSAGAATVVSEQFEVVAPEGYEPAAVDVEALDAGPVLLGASADRTATVLNSGENPVTLAPLALTGAGFTVAGGSCAAGAELDPGESCTVVVRFAPTVAGAAAGTLTVAYSAIGAGEPLAVALGGTGVAPEPQRREPQPDPVTPTPETPAPVTPAPVVPTPIPVAPPSAQPAPAAALAVTFPRAVKASRRGVLTLATLRNAGTAAGTVRVTGTLLVGRARFAIRVTSRVGAGERVTLSVRLSRRARLMLRRRGGTLTLRVKGVSARTVTRRLTVRRG
jgi:hypothetical protein